MTLYGNTSRISVEMSGGGIASVTGVGDRKVVVFARGDVSAGSASANDPTQVSGPGELDSTFGSDTDLVEQIRQLAGNGVGYDNIWGVMPSTTAVTDESAAATSSYSLNNDPIIEDTGEITFQEDTTSDGSGDTDISVEFKYESPPATPTAENTAFVNPNTGEVEFDTAGDYFLDYKYLDWQNAFDGATGVVEEQELGSWVVVSEAESVQSDANTTVDPLRTNQWKMVTTTGLAEPNQTGSDGEAQINVSGYTDGVDDDASFLVGPTRNGDSDEFIAGAVGGIMAGNSISDPIIGDALSGVTDLSQTLNVPDQEDLEAKEVIPLSNSGSPSIEANVSTSTETDWKRTYFARRLADTLILAARAIAKATRGSLNNQNTESVVEEQLSDEIEELIDEGVLRPNTSDEQHWFVSANQDASDNRELDVSFGFTPTGVVDTVDVDATIDY